MQYPVIAEDPIIELGAMHTFFHFHFAAGYIFKGERHPFWEMVYVKNGQVDIGTDDGIFMLGGGDVIFHRPDEFHSIWANYAHTAELIVVSFECDSAAMARFEKQRFRATARQQSILDSLLRAAERTFSAPLDDEKTPKPDYPGGGYTLRLILTWLLMDMLSSGMNNPPIPGSEGSEPDAVAAAMIDDLIGYMRRHLSGDLRFENLCRRIGMSETAVKQLFHRHFDATPMAYYEQVRMGEARRMFRESQDNIATVAYALGFSSPSYFSTRFKAVCGMTPREYLKEIRG